VRRGGLSGTLPLSIAVHLAVLVLVLIIPLTAEVALPLPSSLQLPAIHAVVAPPPQPLVRAGAVRPPQPRPVQSRDAAPSVAPDRIAPERADPWPAMPDLPPGDAAGASADIGATADAAVRTLPAGLPPKQSGPIRVSELVQPPKKMVDVRPLYPEIARQVRIEGTVVLEAILDRTGRVDQLRVVKSVPLLDQAALDAVRQWRYTPSVLNGQPVAVLMTVTIRFQLQ
jgi:periplasmic protein TonB